MRAREPDADGYVDRRGVKVNLLLREFVERLPARSGP